jgi:hypothetical protein
MKDHLDRLIIQITADKKKLSIMICALAIGLLLWGRLLLQGVPRTATADDTDNTAQDTVNPTPNNDQATGSIKNIPVVHVDLPSYPGKDLFGIDPSRYRPIPGADLSKNGTKSTQVKPDSDSTMAVLRDEAGELRLESVLTGNRPRAYINGHLLAPGDEYEGFTLLKVSDRYVILTKYDLFIKLRM